MVERGKIAKIELDNPHIDSEETYMVFDRADGGGISVGIETCLHCDLDPLFLFIETGQFDAVVTIESDGTPQTKFEFYGRELLKIQGVVNSLWEKYDLTKMGCDDAPVVRLREQNTLSTDRLET